MEGRERPSTVIHNSLFKEFWGIYPHFLDWPTTVVTNSLCINIVTSRILLFIFELPQPIVKTTAPDFEHSSFLEGGAMLTFIQNFSYSPIGRDIDPSTMSFDENPNAEIVCLKILTEVIL